MKKLFFCLVFILMVSQPFSGFTQGPPPPPPGGAGMTGGKGTGGNKGPSGAPVGGGLEILVALGLAYAGKKVYHMRKEEDNE